MSGSLQQARPPGPAAPPLPIAIRRAVPADRRAVLDFATRTWDGWDYIPQVWDAWLTEPDGVLLVATPQPGPGPGRDLDRYGRPLDPGRPVAVGRVTMLSAQEAWLEGLRVEPGVRHRRVATTFQAGMLDWARAQGATVARYATGADNVGSHRLAAYHAFRQLTSWRTYEPYDPGDVGDWSESDPVDEAEAGADLEPSPPARGTGAPATRALDADLEEERRAAEGDAGEPDGAAAGTHAHHPVPRVAAALAASPLRVSPDATGGETDRWWARLEADATFAAGGRLYEARPWTFQECTSGRLAMHVARGEVFALERASEGASRWALAIVSLGPAAVSDGRMRTALAAGDGALLLEIAAEVERRCRRPLRIRLPDPDPPLLRGQAAALARAGRVPSDGCLHVFGRPLTADDAYPVPGPAGTLSFADAPRAVARPVE